MARLAHCFVVMLSAFWLFVGHAEDRTSEAFAVLSRRVADIDAEVPGDLGFFIKRTKDRATFEYHTGRMWYFSSTVKIPLAIVLLEQVDAGKLSLSRELTLQATDYVDGAGELQYVAPGTRFRVRELLRRMLVQSDSTATDMLIRLIGEDYWNRRLRELVHDSFGPFTTILQVRRDAYSEIHPRARDLKNTDFIAIRKAGTPVDRVREFARRLRLKPSDLITASLEEAFERYFKTGRNSGTLQGYARMLERLNAGELLSLKHTRLLLGLLERTDTGEARLKAGLGGIPFAHKTGTQVRRICNMGILCPLTDDAVIVAACLEKFDDIDKAERSLARLGEAITGVMKSGE